MVISHSALVVIVCSAGASFANQKAERRQKPPAKSWRLGDRAFACQECTRPWAAASASQTASITTKQQQMNQKSRKLWAVEGDDKFIQFAITEKAS